MAKRDRATILTSKVKRVIWASSRSTTVQSIGGSKSSAFPHAADSNLSVGDSASVDKVFFFLLKSIVLALIAVAGLGQAKNRPLRLHWKKDEIKRSPASLDPNAFFFLLMTLNATGRIRMSDHAKRRQKPGKKDGSFSNRHREKSRHLLHILLSF